MDIEKRLMEYYKRWNIEFSYEEQFEKFKNRVIDEYVAFLRINDTAISK